jgi:alkylation response protein AidB-like acyl-CoA dehydrogenase
VDFSWTAQQQQLRAEAKEVAADAVARYGWTADSWINGYCPPFARELAARGWIGISWPKEFGGAGRPAIDRMIIAEELIGAGAPVGSYWVAERQMGPSIFTFGTADQQQRYLPAILAGEATWCIGMSEPGAGSDLASLRTRAVRDGEDFVVNGQKIWTSFGAVSDFVYLICRTSADGPPHAGISELIVSMDSPGIEVRPIKDMAGGAHFCEVFFTDVRVPATNLVGVAGAAFKQTMRQLEHERGGIDRLVSNHALYRRALDRADMTDPLVRQEVAQLETRYRLGRLLVYREALGQAPKGFSAATKLFCTEHERKVADFTARTFGADAMLAGDVSRGLCYANSYTIMGGTSNILRNIVAERILGLPR